MIRKIRRAGTRRKYKGLMAAVAGAALISTTMLTGYVARAEPAPPPDVTQKAQPQTTDPDVTPKAQPQTTGQDVTHHQRYRYRDRDQATDQSPVQVVRDNAGNFGFNADSDSFSLVNNAGDSATVRVRSGGQTFNVDLVRSGDSWEISTIRGIGDMTHPATYTPASFFYNTTGTTVTTATGTPTVATLGASSQVLYNTDNFKGWDWYAGSYPADMSFGLLMRDPKQDDTLHIIPDNIMSQLANVDFGNQFVLYAHLGTVGAKGYGIAVENVTRTNDHLTITVRTKSPQSNEPQSASIVDTFITIDRSVLDYGNPLYVTVVDQHGTVLTTYTVAH